MPSPHPTNPPRNDRPTAKQLELLRHLARAAGSTFAYPATKAQASREITQLSQWLIENPGPRFDPEQQREIDHELGVPGDATAFGEDEVTGYGADARFTHRPSREDRS